MANWKNIHSDFTDELQQKWEEKGFNYEETQEWINAGFHIQDIDFIYWLKNVKNENIKPVLNSENYEELKRQYVQRQFDNFTTVIKPLQDGHKLTTWFVGSRLGNNNIDITKSPANLQRNNLEGKRNVFINSFFQDLDRFGNYRFYTSPDYFPEKIPSWKSVELLGDKRIFMISLGGSADKWKWQTPTDINQWKNNAVNSLKNILNQGYSGIDINYEGFADMDTNSFKDCMKHIINNIKNSNPNTIISITPFSGIWNIYMEIYNDSSSNIDYVNHQLYSEGDISIDDAKDKCNKVAELVGWNKFVLGVDTNDGSRPSETQRGIQMGKKLNDLVKYVEDKGSPGIFIWTLEDSDTRGYEVEKSIYPIIAWVGRNDIPSTLHPLFQVKNDQIGSMRFVILIDNYAWLKTLTISDVRGNELVALKCDDKHFGQEWKIKNDMKFSSVDISTSEGLLNLTTKSYYTADIYSFGSIDKVPFYSGNTYIFYARDERNNFDWNNEDDINKLHDFNSFANQLQGNFYLENSKKDWIQKINDLKWDLGIAPELLKEGTGWENNLNTKETSLEIEKYAKEVLRNIYQITNKEIPVDLRELEAKIEIPPKN